MVNGIGAACLRIPLMIVALGVDAAAQTPMALHTGSFAPEQAAWQMWLSARIPRTTAFDIWTNRSME